MKYKTAKTANRDAQLKRIYQEIDKCANENEAFYCWGCGRTDRPLSHSHLSNNPEYRLLKENIRLHCFGSSDCCHDRWESHGTPILSIPNYFQELSILSKVDNLMYQKIMTKLGL